MTRCRACGVEYTEDEPFCPSCGVGRRERLPDLALYDAEPSGGAPGRRLAGATRSDEPRSELQAADRRPGVRPPVERSPEELARRRAFGRGAAVGGGVAVLVVAVVVIGLVSGVIAFHPSGRRHHAIAGDAPPHTSRPTSGHPTTSGRPGAARPTATASPPPAGMRVGDVQVVPALTHGPHLAQVTEVARLFDRYFSAINDRSYDDFVATLVPRPGGSLEQWRNLATSHDSDVELFDVGPASNDSGPTASVAFTSRQWGDQGPVAGERCTNWLITYSLEESSGGRLLIDLVAPPAVTHTACQQ